MNFDQINENKAFCVMPWLHLHITTTGHFTLCCISGPRIRKEDGEDFHILRDNIEDFWQSPSMEAIRQNMKDGVKVDNCSVCYKYEEAAGSSTRVGLNNWLLGSHPRHAENREIIDQHSAGKQPPLPGYVDVRLSNLCNLGCRMCSSDASSTIERDEVHSKWSPYTGGQWRADANVEGLDTLARKGLSAESVVGAELQKLKNLYFIQLAGGEPTINAAQISWLKSLAASGDSNQITLSIWTNFTTSNRKIFDVMFTFQSVTLVLSIDGYGEVYNYIRHPGRWSMIEGNLKYISNMREKIYLKMNCVVQAYNALNVIPLLDWAYSNNIEVMLHNVNPQEFLDYRILSADMRQRIRDEWQAYKAKINVDTQSGKSICDSLDKVLAQTSSDFPEEKRLSKLMTFVQFTNDLDRKRGQSLAAVAPEIYQDIVQTFGKWPLDGRFTVPDMESNVQITDESSRLSAEVN